MVNIDEIDEPAIKSILIPPRSVSPAPVPIVTSRGGSWYWPSPGARPDFGFLIPGVGLIAAEARGRAGLSVLQPTAEQQRRCADLEEWSRRAGGRQWFMSWAEASNAKSRVTVFDPGEPLPLSPEVTDMGTRLEKARYDYMFETAAVDDLLGLQVNGVRFRLTTLPLPTGPLDATEWLTVAVSEQRVTLRDDGGLGPTEELPFELADSLLAVAPTPRMVTVLTDRPPTTDEITQILNQAMRLN